MVVVACHNVDCSVCYSMYTTCLCIYLYKDLVEILSLSNMFYRTIFMVNKDFHKVNITLFCNAAILKTREHVVPTKGVFCHVVIRSRDFMS